jgi:hypothetical protein
LFYDGKARNMTFEKFCERLNKAFVDLDQNGEAYTEAKKVRRLLQAVRDPTLDAAKNFIIGSPHIHTLPEAMTHMSNILDMKRVSQKANRSIAAATIKEKKKGKDGGKGKFGKGGGGGKGGEKGKKSAYDPSNPGKSYPPPAWATLSEDEKKKVRTYRAAHPKSGRNIGAVDTEPMEVDTEPETEVPGGEDKHVHWGRHLERDT